MKTLSVFKTGLTVLVMGLLLSLPFSVYSQESIDIQVSPSTLNLQNNGQVVTVHTNIAYGLVVAETVFLNGVEIYSWKADLQGNFVAKFQMTEVIALAEAEVLTIGQYNDLTLTGSKTDDTEFIGTDQVMVIDVFKKK